jgi:hypothetical protein
MFDRIAASATVPSRAEIAAIRLHENVGAVDADRWRQRVATAAGAIVQMKRDGHYGLARRFVVDAANELADEVDVRTAAPDHDNLDPNELAGLITRESSR